MIFVCVGSREYQFNRLLEKVDELIKSKVIEEPVFAQIGQSSYEPKFYNYERFLSSEDFGKKQEEADIIISHGGTGALINSLKLHKQVIAVPRLAKYKEHTDDHQTQVSSVLDKQGYLISVEDMNLLGDAIHSIKKVPIAKHYEKSSKVLAIIENFINFN